MEGCEAGNGGRQRKGRELKAYSGLLRRNDEKENWSRLLSVPGGHATVAKAQGRLVAVQRRTGWTGVTV